MCDVPHLRIGCTVTQSHPDEGIAMRANSQHFVTVQSIFGAGYALDPHSDQRRLPMDDEPGFTDFMKSLGSLIWGEAGQTKHWSRSPRSGSRRRIPLSNRV